MVAGVLHTFARCNDACLPAFLGSRAYGCLSQFVYPAGLARLSSRGFLVGQASHAGKGRCRLATLSRRMQRSAGGAFSCVAPGGLCFFTRLGFTV